MNVNVVGKQLRIATGLLAMLSSIVSCSRGIPNGDDQVVHIDRKDLFANVRIYTKGNITLRSRPIRKGRNYSLLIVGSPDRPYAGVPAILARLPHGDVVNLANIPPRVLMDSASSVSDVGGDWCHEINVGQLADPNARWPHNTLRVQFEYWLFFVKDESILSFRADSRGWNQGGQVPSFGTPDNNELFEFPLKQEQVIKVFGKPDKIREYLEE